MEQKSRSPEPEPASNEGSLRRTLTFERDQAVNVFGEHDGALPEDSGSPGNSSCSASTMGDHLAENSTGLSEARKYALVSSSVSIDSEGPSIIGQMSGLRQGENNGQSSGTIGLPRAQPRHSKNLSEPPLPLPRQVTGPTHHAQTSSHSRGGTPSTYQFKTARGLSSSMRSSTMFRSLSEIPQTEVLRDPVEHVPGYLEAPSRLDTLKRSVSANAVIKMHQARSLPSRHTLPGGSSSQRSEMSDPFASPQLSARVPSEGPDSPDTLRIGIDSRPMDLSAKVPAADEGCSSAAYTTPPRGSDQAPVAAGDEGELGVPNLIIPKGGQRFRLYRPEVVCGETTRVFSWGVRYKGKRMDSWYHVKRKGLDPDVALVKIPVPVEMRMECFIHGHRVEFGTTCLGDAPIVYYAYVPVVEDPGLENHQTIAPSTPELTSRSAGDRIPNSKNVLKHEASVGRLFDAPSLANQLTNVKAKPFAQNLDRASRDDTQEGAPKVERTLSRGSSMGKNLMKEGKSLMKKDRSASDLLKSIIPSEPRGSMAHAVNSKGEMSVHLHMYCPDKLFTHVCKYLRVNDGGVLGGARYGFYNPDIYYEVLAPYFTPAETADFLYRRVDRDVNKTEVLKQRSKAAKSSCRQM